MKRFIVIVLLVLIICSIGLCKNNNPYVGNWKGVISFGTSPSNGYYNFKILYLKTNEVGKSEGAVTSQDSSDSPASIIRIEGTCSRDGSFSYTFLNERGVPIYYINGTLNNFTSENINGLFYWRLFVSDKIESQGTITLIKA